MNHVRLNKLLFAFCILPVLVSAQTLDYPTFRRQVLENHPLARRADLYRDLAQAALFRAKGGFDPKAFVEQSGKNFNGKTYFQYSEAGLKLPTWAGLELKSTYHLATGNFLNNESKLPENGQATFGLSWSLGQGLLFDERRADLQLARAGLEMGEAERLEARNDLLFDAAKAYWTWNYSDNAVRIVADALRQAEGYPRHYRELERVIVHTIDGEREAMTYIATDEYLEAVMDSMRRSY